MKRGKPIPQSTIDFVLRRAGNRCEIKLADICQNRIDDFHHVKARSRGGSNYPVNILGCCRSCHDAVERHRPGTDRYRTYSYQREGKRESDFNREDSS